MRRLSLYGAELEIRIDAGLTSEVCPIDFGLLGARRESELASHVVAKLAFEFGQRQFVVASGAFKSLQLRQVLQIRDLRMLESTYELFSFFFRWDVFRFIQGLYPERCVIANQLLVDLIHHLVDDLQVPLGPATEVIVQHAVLFGEIKQLQA